MKDHEWGEHIICPHCGHVRDAGAVDFNALESTVELECGNCEKPFTATRHCLIRYSTEKK